MAGNLILRHTARAVLGGVIGGVMQGALNGAVNTVLPAHYGACDAAVDIPGRLCADCWSEVSFIVAPLCACCGTPFEIEVEPGSFCGACLRAPPAFGRARAVVLYKNVGRDLVLAFKMADRTWIVPSLGAWMARAGREVLPDADIIAPVPLFRWRLLARRFNQSVLLGAALSRDADAVWMPDLLQRARATKS